jgi:chromosome segregation ATPase
MTSQEELSNIQNKYAQAQDRLNSILRETDTRERDLSKVTQEIIAKEKQTRYFNDEILKLQPQIEELKKDLSVLSEQKDILAKQIAEDTENINRSHQELDGKANEVRLVTESNIEHHQRLLEFESSLNAIQADLYEKKNKHEKTVSDLRDILTKHINDL